VRWTTGKGDAVTRALAGILHDIIRRQLPVLVIPAPDRPLPAEAWAYFEEDP
jgi:hypothetical protein